MTRSSKIDYSVIYTVVREIPPGSVGTYGQVARCAGLPGHARQVGYAMHALPWDTEVPWHRVVNARGEVSERRDPNGAPRQRARLEAEGVAFDHRGRIDLECHGWDPAG